MEDADEGGDDETEEGGDDQEKESSVSTSTNSGSMDTEEKKQVYAKVLDVTEDTEGEEAA